MLHSLESMDFLKVDPENYILFECADEEKVISVEQEFHKGITEETIYKSSSGNQMSLTFTKPEKITNCKECNQPLAESDIKEGFYNCLIDKESYH